MIMLILIIIINSIVIVVVIIVVVSIIIIILILLLLLLLLLLFAYFNTEAMRDRAVEELDCGFEVKGQEANDTMMFDTIIQYSNTTYNRRLVIQ